MSLSQSPPPFFTPVPDDPLQEMENDQPKLKQNNNTFYATFGEDHIWQNENPSYAGMHRKLSFAPQATTPVNNTSQPLIWGETSATINCNTGTGNTYAGCVASGLVLPSVKTTTWRIGFVISGQNFTVLGTVTYRPIAGSSYYTITISTNNTTSVGGSTSYFLFVPYGFTATNIINAYDFFSSQATVVNNSVSSITNPSYQPSATIGIAYKNGAIFRYATNVRSGINIVGN